MQRGDEPQRPGRQVSTSAGVSRREFLVRAGALGLSGSALLLFLQACQARGLPSPVAPVATPPAPPPGANAPPPSILPGATIRPTPSFPVAPAQPIEPVSTPATVPTPPAPTPAVATPAPGPTATPALGAAQPTPEPRVPPSNPQPLPVVYVQPTQERLRLGHLLRRAGFGASHEEMERYRKLGLDGTVDYLIEYQDVDDFRLEERLAGMELDLERIRGLQQWWFLRMVYTQRPLQEKMVLFWHGLLTSGFPKVKRGPMMHRQNQLLRAYALEGYDVFLKAVSRDPAMLIWLDSRKNRKSAPNENYARELMELFSMGVGTFSEFDVREAARAFTGWFVNRNGFVFRSNQHDHGLKSFLGRRGNFDGDDIVDIIVQQPATGDYMARRLFTFFVHDNPDPDSIAALAGLFRDSGYSIKAMMRHILTSQEFYSPRAYRAKMKSPVELIVGAARTMGADTDGRLMGRLADQMGQTLLSPPDVSGWPGGAAWINSTTLLQRMNLAYTLTVGGSRRALDTRQLFQRPDQPGTKEATERFISLFLDGSMPREEQDVLWAYLAARNGGRIPTALDQRALRGLVYLLISSPDYQLA